jgi:meiosis-specific APC/C activator protein AMA1
MRALYAVAYPGGPAISEGSRTKTRVGEDSDDEGEDIRLLRELGAKEARMKRKRESEGCIVVAASDETVRFHEVWGENRRIAVNGRGVLGGSDILESMEGIENEGMLIR